MKRVPKNAKQLVERDHNRCIRILQRRIYIHTEIHTYIRVYTCACTRTTRISRESTRNFLMAALIFFYPLARAALRQKVESRWISATRPPDTYTRAYIHAQGGARFRDRKSKIRGNFSKQRFGCKALWGIVLIFVLPSSVQRVPKWATNFYIFVYSNIK